MPPAGSDEESAVGKIEAGDDYSLTIYRRE
jgi:hypothetical protein